MLQASSLLCDLQNLAAPAGFGHEVECELTQADQREDDHRGLQSDYLRRRAGDYGAKKPPINATPHTQASAVWANSGVISGSSMVIVTTTGQTIEPINPPISWEAKIPE